MGTDTGRRCVRLVAAFAIALAGHWAVAQNPVTINPIGKQGARRIPVAVPPFGTALGQEALGAELSGVVAYDLDFTGLFAVVPAQDYPAGFTGFTADPKQVDFAAWSKSKAEFLVYAYVTAEGDTLAAECRLFDVLAGQQVVGKKLTASGRQWARLIPHQFSEEIVRFLTGTPGIGTSEICFSGGVTGKKEICLADYDGANMRQVTKHGSISILPKLSPDGAKIAYLSFKDRYPFLYILTRATGESRSLSKDVGLNVTPAWSPDGARLAMTLSKDGNEEIYLVNADGSGKKRLTRDKALDTSPSFSPTGQEIAFVSERLGNPQIFAMGADGGNVRRLSFQGGRSYDPAWSPDGKLIAYVAERPGEGLQIYVLDPANGSTYKRLTDSGGSNESPSWSPDSRYVMFSSTRGVWSVIVETGELRPVPNLKVGCQGPDWGPRRH